VAIVGPTAVGKSRLAMELAQRLSAEIVSADSRQVYRYMDIGTAKPSKDEQALVTHYLIDLVAPNESYSAVRYRSEGLQVLRRIGAKGRIALVVGGTGFYIRALLDGLSVPDVPPNAGFRARLRDEARKLGPEGLHERLRRLDPASAARIHQNNLPRLIRALEVIEYTQGPMPASSPGHSIPTLFLGLTMERAQLRSVSDRRVVNQVKCGLVEETRRLLEMGYEAESPAMQGFAYRQMVTYLSGECDLGTAIADYQAATHRYIRRQMTWFRADGRIHWISAGIDNVSTAHHMIDRWLSTAS
jgi:tRNA dimethylallyltransferase